MKYHHTETAPEALGPYSQAVEIDGWVYTSAQSGLDPATGELAEGGFEAQARQVLKNLRAVLGTAGCSFQDVVRTTIYLTDFGNFPAVNKLYAEVMGDHRPARTTLQVSAIPKGGLVGMDMIARAPR
jgi:2-iminobutanoate/2-iminopropanoate deaminase